MSARRRPQARSVFVSCPFDRDYKVCLILDTEPFRYQKFCSDLAGVDIVAHANQPRGIVHAVRNWLGANPGGRSRPREPEILPDGGVIFEGHEQFLNALPDICKDQRLGRDHRSLPFPDYV